MQRLRVSLLKEKFLGDIMESESWENISKHEFGNFFVKEVEKKYRPEEKDKGDIDNRERGGNGRGRGGFRGRGRGGRGGFRGRY